MKKVFFALFVLAAFTLQAQNRKNADRRGNNARQEMADLNPQQRAELKTQRMTLHLDLTEAQQKKVQKLNENMEAKREKVRLTREERQALTKEERYAHKKAMMDEQIEFKRALKEILTEEQYSKFDNNRERRDGKRKSKGTPRN